MLGMKSAVSESSVAKLVEILIRNQQKQALAIRRDDTPTANRYMRKVNQAREMLAQKGSEGRSALEELMRHPMPQVRLDGAISIMQWAPELAIPILGRLIVDTGYEDMSAGERIEIRHDAKLCLYDHFGIRNFDQDKLIEPLKAYGIDLPPRN